MIDVISMSDFSKEQIITVLDVAEDIQRAIHDQDSARSFREKYGLDVHELLKRKRVAALFMENSTRTNFSFKYATGTAGGFVDGFPSAAYSSLKKGETWAATTKQFAGWGVDAIVMRSTIEGLPRWTQEALQRYHTQVSNQKEKLGLPYSYKAPIVINGGDGKNQHPTQCFLDLFTIRQLARSKGRDLDGLEVALLNDLAHGRTNASLMSVAHHFDWKFHFAYPDRFGPQARRLEALIRRGVETVDHAEDFMSAMEAAFVAYHSRPQKERVGVGEDLITIRDLGQINAAMYGKLGDAAPFLMHPLPIDAVTFEEIAHDMTDHPLNMTNVQSENGLYVRIALLALGLGSIKHEGYQTNGRFRENEFEVRRLDFGQGKKFEAHPRSGYIKDSGVVIDHIPAGYGRRLEGILGLECHEGEVVTARNLNTPSGRKDMIKVHDRYRLSDKQLEALSIVAPTATVSYIEDGKVTEKLRVKPGNSVDNLVQCGNDTCVSNLEHEGANSRHLIETTQSGTLLECGYCETPDTLERVRADNRFNYLDTA